MLITETFFCVVRPFFSLLAVLGILKNAWSPYSHIRDFYCCHSLDQVRPWLRSSNKSVRKKNDKEGVNIFLSAVLITLTFIIISWLIAADIDCKLCINCIYVILCAGGYYLLYMIFIAFAIDYICYWLHLLLIAFDIDSILYRYYLLLIATFTLIAYVILCAGGYHLLHLILIASDTDCICYWLRPLHWLHMKDCVKGVIVDCSKLLLRPLQVKQCVHCSYQLK